MKLEFDPVDHRFTLDGSRVPSVTGILKTMGAYLGFDSVSKARREAAMAKGTRIHAICAEITQFRRIPEPDDNLSTLEDWPYITAWIDFLADIDPATGSRSWEPIAVERPLGSTRFRVAGIVDLVARHASGKVWVIDLKTGRSFPKSYAYQVAIYAELWAESVGVDPHDLGLGVVSLTGDGRAIFRDCEAEVPDCRSTALSLVIASHYLAENGLEVVKKGSK